MNIQVKFQMKEHYANAHDKFIDSLKYLAELEREEAKSNPDYISNKAKKSPALAHLDEEKVGDFAEKIWKNHRGLNTLANSDTLSADFVNNIINVKEHFNLTFRDYLYAALKQQALFTQKDKNNY